MQGHGSHPVSTAACCCGLYLGRKGAGCEEGFSHTLLRNISRHCQGQSISGAREPSAEATLPSLFFQPMAQAEASPSNSHYLFTINGETFNS